jgi:Fe-S-cluster containining protein
MAEAGPSLSFRCLGGCNTCCVVRGYLPVNSIRDSKSGKRTPIGPRAMGKEGMVEIEAWKLPRMIKLSRKLGIRLDEQGKPIRYDFLPAKGVSLRGAKAPESVISHWLMGRKEDGSVCPFLSTPAENLRTAGGTLKCLIYEERPLPCRAYPLHAVYTWETTGAKMASLDHGCGWVVDQTARGQQRVSQPFPLDVVKGLDYGSFARLQSLTKGRFDTSKTTLWERATGVYGKDEKPGDAIEGWVDIGWD